MALFSLRNCPASLGLLLSLNKPSGSAASSDVDLEEELFGAEPVAAVETKEELVRARAPADEPEAAEIDTTAHSAQPDIDAHGVTNPVPETTVLFVDTFPARPSRLLFTCLRLSIVLLRPASSNLTS
jgi:hypothetical protein